MSAMVSAESTIAASASRESGEENRTDDEHHTGDDRDPGSCLIKPVGPTVLLRRECYGCGHGILLNCFSHVLIVAAAV